MAEIVASRIDGESIVSAAFRAWAGPFVRASFPKSSIEPLRGQQNVDSTRGHLQALARDSASNFLTYALIEAWVARDIAPLPTTSISPPFTSSQYLEFPQATIRFASACLRRRGSISAFASQNSAHMDAGERERTWRASVRSSWSFQK